MPQLTSIVAVLSLHVCDYFSGIASHKSPFWHAMLGSQPPAHLLCFEHFYQGRTLWKSFRAVFACWRAPTEIATLIQCGDQFVFISRVDFALEPTEVGEIPALR